MGDVPMGFKPRNCSGMQRGSAHVTGGNVLIGSLDGKGEGDGLMRIEGGAMPLAGSSERLAMCL